jgi:UDP-N-acetylmuramoylalanine-D-glutamate ligase
MIIIVCGGRNYQNEVFVDKVLSIIHKNYPISLLIHGGATGADSLANSWAIQNNVSRKVYYADWSQGRKAGPLRNKQMLTENPDLVVAFPGGKGTKNMISQARQANIKILEY